MNEDNDSKDLESEKRSTQIVGGDVKDESADLEHKFRDGLYQSFVSVAALSLLVHIGLCFSLATILESKLNITNHQDAWIASLPLFGTLTSGFFMGPLSDKIGRKWTCGVTAVLISLSWALTFFLPHNFDLYQLYIIRFISGAALGLASTLVYVSEVANKHWRTSLLTLNSFFKASGYPIAAVVGSILPWRYYALFCLIFSLSNFILIIFVPESPNWLFQLDPERAKQALMKLNKNQRDFNDEWETLEAQGQKSTEEAGTSQRAHLLSREVRRPMFLLVILFTLQQFGGIYLVITYPLQIFDTVIQTTSQTLPPTSTTPVNGTVFNTTPAETNQNEVTTLGTACFIRVGVIRLVMAGVAVVLTKYINNRTILITSAAGGAVFAFAFVAVFEGLFGPVGEAIPLLLILAFQLFLSYGVQVTPWTLMGEIIPLSYRAKGNGIALSYSNFVMFIAYSAYPYAVDWNSLTGIFSLFGVVSALTCFFVYFFLPETRGKSFAVIEAFFR